MAENFISFEAVSKRFPGVTALNQVSFSIARGSCHALMGENGAGKSTLGKILAGVYTADSGVIRIDGRETQIRDPLDARRHGVAIVHQELAFCPNLSVAENLSLGSLPSRAGWVNRGQLRQAAVRMLSPIDASIDVDLPIGRLNTGQEQMVQIAAAVGSNARILVFDEPTSSLSAMESERLFELLGRLKAMGITVIYVSHRMDEIFRLCDSITVLRDGCHVATMRVQETSRQDLIERMVGRKVEAVSPQYLSSPPGEERLRLEDVRYGSGLGPVSLSLHAGEILGFAGLVGAGRSELAQALFGMDPQVQGGIFVNGKNVAIRHPVQAMDHGIGFLPEDRKRQGLVLGLSCRENGSMAILKDISRMGWVRRGEEKRIVSELAGRLRVKAPSIESEAGGLSGGNQQKIAFIKWLARRCQILVVDEPTRGVDVGAKAEIHQLLDQLAAQGTAILLISSELPELLTLSRRVVVLREGRIMGEVGRSNFSEKVILRMMSGLQQEQHS